MHGRLDSTDRAILKELQDEASITNLELARRVGLSAPPCLRRVWPLEQAGIIKACRAMLDPKALGFEIVCVAMVQLDAPGQRELAAFDDRMKGWPMVRECWSSPAPSTSSSNAWPRAFPGSGASSSTSRRCRTSATCARHCRSTSSRNEPIVPLEEAVQEG